MHLTVASHPFKFASSKSYVAHPLKEQVVVKRKPLPIMSTSPNKPAVKAAHLTDPSTIPLPASPQKPRSIRKLQSHQQLSSNSPSLISQQRQQQQQQRNVSLAKKDSKDNITSSAQTPSINIPARMRAHSDAPLSMKRGSNRKPYGLSHGRKSSLEVMLREGPSSDDLEACLNDVRYKILISKVEASADGMVCLTLSPHILDLL